MQVEGPSQVLRDLARVKAAFQARTVEILLRQSPDATTAPQAPSQAPEGK